MRGEWGVRGSEGCVQCEGTGSEGFGRVRDRHGVCRVRGVQGY